MVFFIFILVDPSIFIVLLYLKEKQIQRTSDSNSYLYVMAGGFEKYYQTLFK